MCLYWVMVYTQQILIYCTLLTTNIHWPVHDYVTLSIEANYPWYCLFMHVMPPTGDTSVGVPSVCFKPITNLNLHSQSLLFPCYCFDCFYWQPWLFDIYLFATLCTMQWRNKRSDWDQNENWEIALVASTNMLHAKYNVHAH